MFGKKLLMLPHFDIGFEYLSIVKNKREEHLFYGNTSVVPVSKRVEVMKFFKQAKKDGWLYITEGAESAVNSFRKDDFTKILKDNNLPVTGNKPQLVDRIIENLGFDKLNELGEISNKIKLSKLGKEKLDEYSTEFYKQYTIFKQEVENMFDSNKIKTACYNVLRYRESRPFNNPEFYISYSSDELYNICKKIKNTDILKRIELPKSYHNKILNTMCMYYSFRDFDYKVELEKIYNGFEQLLINSNIIINKEYPFFDFNCYIKGEKIVSFKERLPEI